jgi:hypothetical protein
MLLIHGDFVDINTRFIHTFNEIADSIGKDFSSSTSIESKELEEPGVIRVKFKGFPTIKFFSRW